MNDINFKSMMCNNGQDMYRESIIDSLSQLLTAYTRTFSKTMIIRFDVTYPKKFTAIEDNSDMSALMKQLIQYCSRRKVSPAYFWVREQSLRSDNQHYHCMLLLDGNKTCSYYPYIEAAEEMWGRILDVDPKGLIHYCNRDLEGNKQANGIILRSDDPNYEDKIDTVVRLAMYLAKDHTKGFYNDGFRDFGTSNIDSIQNLRSKYRQAQRRGVYHQRSA